MQLTKRQYEQKIINLIDITNDDGVFSLLEAIARDALAQFIKYYPDARFSYEPKIEKDNIYGWIHRLCIKFVCHNPRGNVNKFRIQPDLSLRTDNGPANNVIERRPFHLLKLILRGLEANYLGNSNKNESKYFAYRLGKNGKIICPSSQVRTDW